MHAPTKHTAEQLYVDVLVLRCQTGDDHAFAELVERYQERLGYYIRRLLRPTEDPDDVLQDVWLTVYRKLPALQKPRAFTVWLYRIARNAALTRIRGRRAWVQLQEELAAGTERGDELAILTEDVARLHGALDRLPPEHKEVLTLRFLEEMSYEDIAGVVGCAVGTIRSRLHYAKQSLERELRGEQ